MITYFYHNTSIKRYLKAIGLRYTIYNISKKWTSIYSNSALNIVNINLIDYYKIKSTLQFNYLENGLMHIFQGQNRYPIFNTI